VTANSGSWNSSSRERGIEFCTDFGIKGWQGCSESGWCSECLKGGDGLLLGD